MDIKNQKTPKKVQFSLNGIYDIANKGYVLRQWLKKKKEKIISLQQALG